LLALLGTEPAWALVGQITHLSGAVLARRDDGASRILSIKSEVREGDLLITSDNAYARIKFSDGGEVVLRPSTQVKINAYQYEERAPEKDSLVMSLVKGGLRSVTGLLARRNPGSYRLAAPSATIGIRGTSFGALFCNDDCQGVVSPGGEAPPNGLHVDVADGTISVTTNAGTVEFKVGEFGFVQNVNVLPVPVPAERGTRVTLPPQALNQPIQGGGVGKSGELECTIR
jgi:hypothetical protein